LNNLSIVTFEGKRSAENEFRLGLARRAGITILRWPLDEFEARKDFDRADILLDAVFGRGLSRPMEGDFASVAGPWAKAAGMKIALDVPSGFRSGMEPVDPVLRADVTFAIGLPQECLYIPAFRALAGEIRLIGKNLFPVASLKGTAQSAFLYSNSDLDGALPAIARDAHKGSRGRVAILAGSPGMAGAAFLSARAAARSGAGYVKLITTKSTLDQASGPLGGLIVEALPDPSVERAACLESSLEGQAAILAGPGWRPGEETRGMLEIALAKKAPLVLDAGALGIIAGGSFSLAGRETILTPHPKEASRLLGLSVEEILSSGRTAARAIADRYGATAVLKGSVTWIAGPAGWSACVDGSLPALATSGTGDVLAGIAAGFLARGMDAREAAIFAVLCHARAGRAAFDADGYFQAEDLLPWISRIARDAEERSDRAR
jgi:NAD(P)H-hydrate epimerase